MISESLTPRRRKSRSPILCHDWRPWFSPPHKSVTSFDGSNATSLCISFVPLHHHKQSNPHSNSAKNQYTVEPPPPNPAAWIVISAVRDTPSASSYSKYFWLGIYCLGFVYGPVCFNPRLLIGLVEHGFEPPAIHLREPIGIDVFLWSKCPTSSGWWKRLYLGDSRWVLSFNISIS